MKDLGQTENVVLLVDNCAAHHNAEELNFENFFVRFFPRNVTSLIQPMDQGIIETLKRSYKNSLLRELLFALESNKVSTYEEFMKSVDMPKVSDLFAESWDLVSPVTLRRGWNKILPGETQVVQENWNENDAWSIFCKF